MTSHPHAGEARTWTSTRDDEWTLLLDDVVQGNGGPVRSFQKFNSKNAASWSISISVEASQDLDSDLERNIHELVSMPKGADPLPWTAVSRDAELPVVARCAAMPAPRMVASALALLTFCFVAQAQQVIPLWKNGAPGFEARRAEPEQHKDWWYKNIHNPSLTIYLPPAGKANGTAVIVAAGGGHRELVFNPEGVEPAQYLASLGITAFALKYRLFREPGSKLHL